jgi:hypothetical protein
MDTGVGVTVTGLKRSFFDGKGKNFAVIVMQIIFGRFV